MTHSNSVSTVSKYSCTQHGKEVAHMAQLKLMSMRKNILLYINTPQIICFLDKEGKEESTLLLRPKCARKNEIKFSKDSGNHCDCMVEKVAI